MPVASGPWAWVVVVGLLVGCSSEPEGTAPRVCDAIAEVAELDVSTRELLEQPWDVAVGDIEANIAKQNSQFDVVIAADVADVSDAAADIKAFNEAMVEAGAFDVGSAQEFSDLLVAGVNGSAEAGAGKATLQDYAAANCT